MSKVIAGEAHAVASVSLKKSLDIPGWLKHAGEVKFRRLSDEAVLPTRAHPTDAGLDLTAVNGATVPPAGIVTFHTALSVEIPLGYAGLLYVRSSLGAQGLTLGNSVGVIDSGYRGELMIKLINNSGNDATIMAGSRIAQLLITPVALPAVVEVVEQTHSERGDGGFGSTGE